MTYYTRRNPMNTIRMIAVALPMTILIACGGGGGGGGTAAAPTRPPTNMPDMPNPVTLPGYAITNLDIARTAVGGTAPTGNMTEMEIITAIQTRATAADTFEFSDFSGTPDVEITCQNKFCSGSVPDVGTLTFSLTGIEDLSLVNDTGLVGFNSESQVVMEHQGATVIQSQSAGRQSDGTRLTFQTYGGWFDGSVFGVELIDVTESATTTNRFAAFSFGKNSGSNPGSDANWNGVMVGADTATDHIVHGRAAVQFF